MRIVLRLLYAGVLFVFANSLSFAENEKSLTQWLSAADLPDYSFAGFQNGEPIPHIQDWQTYLVTDHGLKPNDGRDDSVAMLKLLAKLNQSDEPAIVQFPSGRFVFSSILFIERANIILRGAGSGENGTEIHFPRPLLFHETPAIFQELEDYIAEIDLREQKKQFNLDMPYSLYTWSGGYIWTHVPGERVKAYLERYHQPLQTLTTPMLGKQGDFTLTVDSSKHLKAGDVVQLVWYNKRGKNAQLLKDLYPNQDITIGENHWQKPKQPIIRQALEIAHIDNNKLTFKAPLLFDINPLYDVELAEWKHLKQVGFEHLRFSFPMTADIGHHVEQGSNALYLTRLFNSWVKDVVIVNADSGILTEDIANTTIQDVTTTGDKLAHYTVQMGANHNVLVDNMRVENPSRHALSFNTGASKNVYTNCEVMQTPMFDQHSGANNQNLFDRITVHVTLDTSKKTLKHPLFKAGGAKYWQPHAGVNNTFWNIDIKFTNGIDKDQAVELYGGKQTAKANLIGFHGDKPLKLNYQTDPTVLRLNQSMDDLPSLYLHQKSRRIQKAASGQ